MEPGIAKFEISDRHAILYVDKIPSDHELCFNLEMKRDFEVGLVQPVPVTVYDYYEPGQYNPVCHSIVYHTMPYYGSAYHTIYISSPFLLTVGAIVDHNLS